MALGVESPFAGNYDYFAIVSLSPQHVDRYLSLMDQAREILRNANNPGIGILLPDHSIDIYRVSGKRGARHIQTPSMTAIFKMLHAEKWRMKRSFLAGDLSLGRESVEKVEVEDLQARVYGSGIRWVDTSTNSLFTTSITRWALLVSKLYYAETPEEVDERYMKLAEEMPAEAIDILKEGICVVGREPMGITPRKEALLPLLMHPSESVRMEAILLLEKKDITPHSKRKNPIR